MILFYVIIALVLVLGFTAFTGAPYVPSKKRELRQVFKRLYVLSSKDTLVDLGSGDGVVLREARRCGAVAVGYEIGPVYVAVSRLLAHGDKKQQIIAKSYWKGMFPAATTVVYTFGTSRDIGRMYTLVQREATRLGHALAFISYGIAVPGVIYDKKQGAHFLYTIAPCGNEKP